jgi:hypothetical protein
MAELVRFAILFSFKSQRGFAVDLKRPNRKLVEVRGHLTLLAEAGMRARFPKVGTRASFAKVGCSHASVCLQTAIWLTLSLFIGAFSASLAATEGGGIRDGTWGKKARPAVPSILPVPVFRAAI